MKPPALVFALGPEAAAIAARAKAIWQVWGTFPAVLAIGPQVLPGLDAEHEVAPLERDGQDLPRAAIATALAGFDSHPDVIIVADLAEHEAGFCARLAAETRRAIGPDGRLTAILILPGPERMPLELSAAGDILGVLWPGRATPRLLDRLYLVEDAAESGAAAARETIREAVAWHLAIVCDAGSAGEAFRTRSDALGGEVRSLGAVALRYPGRAVAELAGARLAVSLVEGWYGTDAGPGGPLPASLPVDDDALEFAGLTPELAAELEASLDELLWSLRARHPGIAAMANVLPAELSLLEEAQFGHKERPEKGPEDRSEDGLEGDIPELVRLAREPRPRSVLEAARDRLHQQVATWRSRIEWELVDRCRPAFLDGGGLARGLGFLESLLEAVARLDQSLADRRRLADDRRKEARQRLDSALGELGAASRRMFFRKAASAASLADCRRAAMLYLTMRAELELLADFQAALSEIREAIGHLRTRLVNLRKVLEGVRSGLEQRADAIAHAWNDENLLDPGDPETAYRDAVGPLPDEEALLASVHEDFVAGGSVLDLPIQIGDEQHLIERLHERAILRFPTLLEATFGQGLAQRLPNASMRAQRLSSALETATPLLRLTRDADGNLPGKVRVVLAHEPSPPPALVTAIERLGIPAEERLTLPRKMADRLIIWTERAAFSPERVSALSYLPGSWPPREPSPEPGPSTTDGPAPASPEEASSGEAERDGGARGERPVAFAERFEEPGLTPGEEMGGEPGAGGDPIEASIRQAEDAILEALVERPPAIAAGEESPLDPDDGLLAQMLAEEGLT